MLGCIMVPDKQNVLLVQTDMRDVLPTYGWMGFWPDVSWDEPKVRRDIGFMLRGGYAMRKSERDPGVETMGDKQ